MRHCYCSHPEHSSNKPKCCAACRQHYHGCFYACDSEELNCDNGTFRKRQLEKRYEREEQTRELDFEEPT